MRECAMSPPNTASHAYLSRPWRFTSSLIMGLTGSLSRTFLFGLNRTEVIGLDRFVDVLEKRKDVNERERGLITGTFPRKRSRCLELD